MVEPKIVSPSGAPQQPVSQDSFAGQSATGPNSTNQALEVNSRNSPGLNIWLLRLRALLFVTVCATLGVLLLILPWTPKWTDNPLLLTSPGLRDFVSSGFVRGLASGLGALDLLLGFWEAIHYHESPKLGV